MQAFDYVIKVYSENAFHFLIRFHLFVIRPKIYPQK